MVINHLVNGMILQVMGSLPPISLKKRSELQRSGHNKLGGFGSHQPARILPLICSLPSPKTNSSPLKIGHPKRKFHLPTIHFRVRTASFREGIWKFRAASPIGSLEGCGLPGSLWGNGTQGFTSGRWWLTGWRSDWKKNPNIWTSVPGKKWASMFFCSECFDVLVRCFPSFRLKLGYWFPLLKRTQDSTLGYRLTLI